MHALTASLVRVKRRSPCPICGKPDWRLVSDDGVMAICMRVAEGSIKESKNGGYTHILEEREYRPLNPIQHKPEPPAPASLERREAVYRAMLATLTLTARHHADLQLRGLSPLAIARNGYASLPPSLHHAQKLCEGLQRQGYRVSSCSKSKGALARSRGSIPTRCCARRRTIILRGCRSQTERRSIEPMNEPDIEKEIVVQMPPKVARLVKLKDSKRSAPSVRRTSRSSSRGRRRCGKT